MDEIQETIEETAEEQTPETPEQPAPETPKPEETKVEETPEVEDKNSAQAAIVFEKFPHVHTIWFDDAGAWRFYSTPGTTPIERPTQKIDIDITNL